MEFEKGTLYGNPETIEKVNSLIKVLEKHVGMGNLPNEIEEAFNDLDFWESE
jgi:hypothetical protein